MGEWNSAVDCAILMNYNPLEIQFGWVRVYISHGLLCVHQLAVNSEVLI